MDWARGRTIGRGSSATVSIATAQRSGEVFAVKSTELSRSGFLKREQNILCTLRCPQIIAYKGSDVTAENGQLVFNLFMEYAPHGTLTDAIRNRGGCLDEATTRFYTREILLGLEYLHSNGIVHCDIKGDNILLTENGLKIADLGCARRVVEESGTDWATTTPIAGTPVYMAPEVARGEHQGFPADVWAVGCTLIEMATGRAPWPDVLDPISALYRIGFSGDVPDIPSFMSKKAKDFLSRCLKRDPVERWSASELLKHSFLEEPIFIPKEINSSNSDTPASVLDHGFWDSMEEELETIQNATHQNSSNSPMERIKQLSEGNTKSSKMPNWTWTWWDGNWVTVRSNSMEELEIFSSSRWRQDHYLIVPGEPTRTGGVETCNTSVICCYKNSTSGPWMACKCKNDTLCDVAAVILRRDSKFSIFIFLHLTFSAVI